MEYTEEQLQQKLAEKEAELKAKHDQEMANLRKQDKEAKEKAVAEAVENAKLSESERAKKEAEEELAKKEQELNELRAFKQKQEIKDELKSAEVPEFFINDSRLLSATKDGRADVIKTIKAEYEKTLPNGSRANTNVTTTTTTAKPNDDFSGFRNLGVSGSKS